jgi:hypothetical protein
MKNKLIFFLISSLGILTTVRAGTIKVVTTDNGS